MVVLVGVAADEIGDDDAALAAVAVLEADNDHAVVAEALAPAVASVFLGDAARRDELVVAAGADVVVAGVAAEAVVACVGGRDGVAADVAQRGKGERAEYRVGYCEVAWAMQE